MKPKKRKPKIEVEQLYLLPVRRHKSIPLLVYNVSREDANRFATLFIHAWETMEFDARRYLLRSWRKRRAAYLYYPFVILAGQRTFARRYCSPGREKPLAFFHPESGFYFSAEIMAESDDFIESIIIHELSHDCLDDAGLTADELGEEKLEAECNELVRVLGFSFDTQNENWTGLSSKTKAAI
ncbi:MAG: hypothetical protein FJ263_07145 [Planctomycetes bacterium]|nr:hypothetical protein [Planctomycetota bacterium]